MKKDLAVIGGLFLFIVLFLVFGRGFSSVGLFGSRPATEEAKTSKESVEVKVKSLTVAARVANEPSERKIGLSKTDSLPLNEAMLFVFEQEGQYGIWMKDMNFAIDIIWIDKDKKIVDIAENAAPAPGKKDAELTIYKPKGIALYVLEINAGLSALHDLNVGDKVDFSL